MPKDICVKLYMWIRSIAMYTVLTCMFPSIPDHSLTLARRLCNPSDCDTNSSSSHSLQSSNSTRSTILHTFQPSLSNPQLQTATSDPQPRPTSVHLPPTPHSCEECGEAGVVVVHPGGTHRHPRHGPPGYRIEDETQQGRGDSYHGGQPPGSGSAAGQLRSDTLGHDF